MQAEAGAADTWLESGRGRAAMPPGVAPGPLAL